MPAQNLAQEPRLPPELERSIFELATFQAPRATVVDYILVSRRVLEWIRPFLYHVLTIASETKGPAEWKPGEDPMFPGTLSRLSDVGKHLNFLLIHLSHEIQDRILRTLLPYCPNIRDMALWYYNLELSQNATRGGDSSMVQLLPKKYLRRLSCPLIVKRRQDLVVLDAFVSLTHLVMRLAQRDWKTWSLLTRLVNLSHLTISNSCVDIDVLINLLHKKNLPKLEVLVFAQHRHRPEEKDLCMVKSYLRIKDHRLVLLQADDYYFAEALEDWKAGTDGRPDFWVHAERVAEARRRKLFIDQSLNKQDWMKRVIDNWDEILNEEGKKWLAGL